MPTETVYSAIKAHLSDASVVSVLAENGIVPPFRWKNDRDFRKPEPPAPWIAFDIVNVLYKQVSIGAGTQAANRWDQSGFAYLPIFIPSGDGAERAHELSKLLADIFRGENTLMNERLEFFDAFLPDGEDAPEEGNWFRFNFSIEWKLTAA